MGVASQLVISTKNPFSRSFRIGVFVSLLLTAGSLPIWGIPLASVALLLIAVVLLWMAFRFPVFALGAVLAFMPLYPVLILVARFVGPSYLMSNAVLACDRVVLLLLTSILWWRNGIKFKLPDLLLVICFALAIGRLAFGGSFLALLSDFNLMIAYFAGRMAVLSTDQEKIWAKRAVWIVAILSILGMGEVFFIGEAPRAILYSTVADEQVTDLGALNGTFHAEGFTGLRESSTMFGPLQFASLCMVGIIIWWVYGQSLGLGVAIVAGLVCTVTRSAWLGTALAIPVLAVVMHEKKRLLLHAALALGLFVAAIPVVGIGDFLFAAKKGEDPSAQGHQQSLFMGLNYALNHPLGSGPGNVGMWGTKTNSIGVFIESTYLTLAAEYGIVTAICFMVFLISALRMCWRKRTLLGYVAVGILVGFGAVMTVAPLHNVFSLASWVWFPVGLAIQSEENARLDFARDSSSS
jgi:hypothetical protein